MPKSRVRKKKVYTPPADVLPRPTAVSSKKQPSPTWVPITAVVLIVLGIAWLVAYYLSNAFFDMPGPLSEPLSGLGFWNLAIGFGALVGSLMVLSRWR
ncbi:MAG: cell division protein CrgA [Micromonosporaceae bacterium]|nr:cell division protein CrgA [Micromonosporaceae bacterium]